MSSFLIKKNRKDVSFPVSSKRSEAFTHDVESLQCLFFKFVINSTRVILQPYSDGW